MRPIAAAAGLFAFASNFAPAALAAEGGGTPLTIDRIFGEPSLSGKTLSSVTWLPDGSAFVYTKTVDVTVTGKDGKASTEKRSEIVRVDPETGAESTLVSAEKYEAAFSKATIGESRPSGRPGFGGYSFAQDGRSFLVTVGGDLYLYDFAKSETRRLTATQSPERNAVLSKDGLRVAFVRDHDVFSIDLATGLEYELTSDGDEDKTNGLSDWVYDEELYLSTGLFFSPDGSKIAYLRFDETNVPKIPIVDFVPYRKEVEWQRYPKAGDPNPVVTLGVVASTKPGTTWVKMPEDVEYVARVHWTPDSASVGAQVLNRRQNRNRVLLADPATGESRVVIDEKAPHWLEAKDGIRFLADGRILWSSERDGFEHLYVMNADGTVANAVTRGPWNVEKLHAFDEERGLVYFTAGEKSPLETHYYRAPLDGSRLERLTEGDGNHSANASPNAAYFVDSWSTVHRPTRMDLRRADGTLVRTLAANEVAELASLRLGETKFVQFATADGVTLNGQFILPPDFDPARKHPVLVHVYGGPMSQTVRNSWGGTRYLWHQMLADRGFVVFLMDNRGSNDHGIGVAGPAMYRNLGRTELADWLEGVRFLRTHGFVDGERIGIWGWSYGGYTAAHSILNAPEAFRAAIAVAPVSDWRDYDTIYTERYMGLPADNEEGYKASAPRFAAEKLVNRLFLIHGTADDNVHFQNSIQLVDALVKAGKQFDFACYPGGRHGIGGPQTLRQLYTAMTDFLVRELRPERPAPAAIPTPQGN